MFVRILIVALLAALVVSVAARRSDGAGPERTYLVKPYDTLWSIAADHYSGDPREGVWRIERRNRLRGAIIHPRQVLILP